jgi:hypothetical protein
VKGGLLLTDGVLLALQVAPLRPPCAPLAPPLRPPYPRTVLRCRPGETETTSPGCATRSAAAARRAGGTPPPRAAAARCCGTRGRASSGALSRSPQSVRAFASAGRTGSSSLQATTRSQRSRRRCARAPRAAPADNAAALAHNAAARRVSSGAVAAGVGWAPRRRARLCAARRPAAPGRARTALRRLGPAHRDRGGLGARRGGGGAALPARLRAEGAPRGPICTLELQRGAARPERVPPVSGVCSCRGRVDGRLRCEPACADRARGSAPWQADPKDGRPLRLRCVGRAGFAPLDCAASTLLERAVFWSGSGPERAGVVRVPAGGATLYCAGPHEFRLAPAAAGAPRAARGLFSSAV